MAKVLTKKQELFVAEYLTDLNATRAACAAGYSAKSAESQGAQLLQNPKVSAEISKKHGKRLEKLEVTAERVLSEIAKLAFFDPRKLFKPDGSPKHILDLDDDTAVAVAGLEVSELFEGSGEQKRACGSVRKIKLADKGVNLERLGKHLKLFTDKRELTVPDGSSTPKRLTLEEWYAEMIGGRSREELEAEYESLVTEAVNRRLAEMNRVGG
jgi:phage terminase small subunit